ncbi:MAG: hypothetical protein A2101_00680 [Spirochaetes bacterium GWF2_52_7]|nr:MAG: hypothetical protein A2101_00680 [Spirochaetes bacterium GWF2_52_7]
MRWFLKLKSKKEKFNKKEKKDEYIDKTSALRKLLYQGAEDYLIDLYLDGRLSIGKIAEILEKTVYDVHAILLKKGIKVEHDREIIENFEKIRLI